MRIIFVIYLESLRAEPIRRRLKNLLVNIVFNKNNNNNTVVVANKTVALERMLTIGHLMKYHAIFFVFT